MTKWTHSFYVCWARRMLFALSFALCALSSNTYAALSGPLVTVAYDGFGYVAGNSLPSQSGGTGWGAAWIKDYGSGGNFTISGTGLTYTGLTTTGGSIVWGAGGNGIDGNARSLPLVNSGVVYLQFLSQFPATSGGGTPNVRLTASGTLTGGIGGNGGAYGAKMSILDSGLNPKVDGTSSSTANLSALNLVIVQIDYQNTKTSMWVNPDLSTFDYLAPPATAVVYAGLAPAFDKVAVYSRSPAKFDELAVIRAAPGAPGAPTGVTAVAGNQQATVTFTAPASDAGATITGYTVTSNPGGGADSNAGTTGLSHVMTGLTNGTSYTFTVTATNSAGTGSQSTASTSVTPMGSQTITFGAAPTITVGSTGTVSAAGGASGNSVTFTSTTPAACTVNSGTGVVTGLAAGTNNCTIAANQAGNGGYSAAPQANLSFSISQISQTITFGASPNLVVGSTGTVTTTGGGSGIARVYASSTPAACTVNSNTGVVTGVAAGSNNCTITADQAGNASYGAAPQASLSFGIGTAPVVQVVPFIPALTSLPVLSGLGSNLLTVLNLSEGAGPALTSCLRDTLSSLLGSDWRYQGQGTDGGARLGQGSQVISFNALEANASTNHGLGSGTGIYLHGANQLDVVTACGTVVTTPAMYNLGEFGSLLNAAGLTAQINAQGVMTVQVGSLIYVARPDYLVTQGAPEAPGLTLGTDGLLRFTDSAGYIQILYPAFLDSEVLGNQVAQAVSGYLVIQTDGTALVTLIGGQQFVLTPDLTLGTVPPEFLAVGWWQDGANHYRYRTSSYSNTSQGFTVTPR